MEKKSAAGLLQLYILHSQGQGKGHHRLLQEQFRESADCFLEASQLFGKVDTYKSGVVLEGPGALPSHPREA